MFSKTCALSSCSLVSVRCCANHSHRKKERTNTKKERTRNATPFKVSYEKSFKLITFFIIRLFVFNYSTLFFQHEVTKLTGLSSLVAGVFFYIFPANFRFVCRHINFGLLDQEGKRQLDIIKADTFQKEL